MTDTGYSRTPKLLKGAIIQFSAPMLIPIPNIIIFQYNPETMTRTLTPWAPLDRKREFDDHGNWTNRTGNVDQSQLNSLAQPFDPKESFSLTLELDATDALEFPDSHPVATVAGVADRISALEMLLYPPGESAIGGLLNVAVNVSLSDGVSIGSGAKAEAIRKAQRKEVPIVLFFWGPGRVVPVRLTTFSVEEQAFSPLLYPIRAKVTLGLLVMDENDLVSLSGEQPDKQATMTIAKACYKFTRAQKEALAMANIANSVESIMGMLPS
jgi:hypothetical protein